MPTLTDTRGLTLDQAKADFQRLALLECELAKIRARYDLRLAKLTAEYEDARSVLDAEHALLEQRLDAYIMSHPDQFKRPRMVRTEFGRFGMRDVSNVEIHDEAAVLAWARDCDFDDVYQERIVLSKAAIAKHLKAGEDVPGACVENGVRARYVVDRQLLDEATRNP